jgi:zinc transport system ATP-binding protein
MSLIKCQNAAFGYNGSIVVKNLNFQINRKEYFCIIGENGSGKSTLIKGMLKLKRPMDGDIVFGDGFEDNEIGYLPQSAPVQKDFPAGVFEVVMSGFLNKVKFFYTKKNKSAAEENLNLLGVKNLKNKCYRELSGGQQQRVLLARALCAASKTLILDEPVSGLDALAAADLYQAIEMLNKEKEVTIIMVSHDLGRVIKYADTILHLQNKQIFFGSAQEYINSQVGKRFMSFESKEDDNGDI